MANLEGASITREQFLIKEMRIACRLHIDGLTPEDIVDEIKTNNLFQYPTEKMVPNIARVCCKRIKKVGSAKIIELIAYGQPIEAAQANLYVMMCTYPLVNNFMTELIAKKYASLDYTLSAIDMNAYMSHLQYEYDNIAAVTDLTIGKIKQVLRKSLVECGMLDSPKSDRLNPIFIEPSVRTAIINNNDAQALPAFNCQDVI